MRRKLIIPLSLLLLSLAGCTATPNPNIASNYTGLWNTTEDVVYYVDGNHHTTVIEPNSTELEVWTRGGLGGDQPVRFDDPMYRYKNGTVVNVTTFEFGTSRTQVTLPGNEGKFAFTSQTSPGRLSRPLPVAGSVRVVLPNNTDARNLFLGGISPAGYEVVQENPLTIKWEGLERGTLVEVRYYNERDPLLLIALLLVLVAAALVVLLYYKRVFKELRDNRSGVEDEL